MGTSQSKLEHKRQAISERRGEIERWLTENPLPISELEANGIMLTDAVELRDRLAAGLTSCEVVTLVACHAAWKSHLLTNCLTEIMFEDALKRARVLDRLPADERKRMHGIPMTVKDHFDFRGVDSTCGYSKFSFEPRPHNSLLVDILQELGGIVVAKTNVPQTLMTFECANPVFGRTLNPHNVDFAPGGSSGGEGAILGSNGIQLGWGSDIGGSIRIPANFCGVYGLKPSAFRLPTDGNYGVDENDSMIAVAGPMANSVRDLAFSFESVISARLWLRSPDLIPLEFRPFAFPSDRPLRIGYYVDDGFVSPTPSCQRAVLESVELLRMKGHLVTEFKLPDAANAAHAYMSLVNLDGGKVFHSPLESDPLEPTVGPILKTYYVPGIFKGLVASFLRWWCKDVKAALIIESSLPKDFCDQFRISGWRKAYRKRFLDEWTSQGDFDFLIAPVSAQAGIKHDTFHEQTMAASYTFLYNLIDFSVGVIPAVLVDADLDATSQLKDKKSQSILERMVYQHYDPKKANGLPVGLQIVCKRWEEEKCLEAMKVVDEIINTKI
eukprot:Partr_v1_DN26248_c1_g1_i2_m48321 putative amide hydrolase